MITRIYSFLSATFKFKSPTNTPGSSTASPDKLGMASTPNTSTSASATGCEYLI